MPCSAGWHGTSETVPGANVQLQTCKPCTPNTLQPSAGQTSCLPCPDDGVDCTVQDRVDVLPGWYRPTAEVEATQIALTLTVAGTVEAFNASAFEASLRAALSCDAPSCDVELRFAAASVRIDANVTAIDVPGTNATAIEAAHYLSRLTDVELSEELNEAIVDSLVVSELIRVTVTAFSENITAPLRCPQRAGCLGGDSYETACAEGHTGALCGTCESSYFRSGGRCSKCDEDAVRSISFFASGAALTAFLAFSYMAFQLRRSVTQKNKGKDEGGAFVPRKTEVEQHAKDAQRTLAAQLRRRFQSAGTMAKILLAYFQVLNAFSQLPSLRWPPRFARFLERLSLLSFELFSVSPLSCRFDIEVTFAHELLSTLLLPIVGSLTVLLLAWLAAQCTLPREQRGVFAVAARPETCSLQLWLLLLLYPSLAKTALIPFDCVELGSEGSVLRAEPSVACYDAEWRVLVVLGAIGTILYALGFPLLCYVVTRAAHLAPKRAADEEQSPASAEAVAAPVEPASTSSEAVATSGDSVRERRAARVRLLFRSYHSSYWWWESLEVLRKYFLTSVVLVVEPSSRLQVYLGQLICVLSIILVAFHQPYESLLCGRVQLLALAQITFTYISGGMLFFDDGDGGMSEDHEDRWGVVLIVVNLAVFAVLGVGVCGAVGGSLRQVRTELHVHEEEVEHLELEIAAMRAELAEPIDALRRARILMDELGLASATRIGAGQFGEVFKATYHGTPVAVKTMHAHHAAAEARVAAFRDEVLLLLELRHPNIVQFIGGSWDVESGDMCLVLELCRGGSLEQLLEHTLVPLSWVNELLPIATGIARGMAYLHRQEPSIVHRDLKPANVLLSADLTPKVADMGTALEMTEGMEEHVAGSGSPLFQAPEVLRREQADEMCDVWAYGCLLCCLCIRSKNPYDPIQISKAVELVTLLELQPSAPRDSPFVAAIEMATALEYEDRLSFLELLELLENDETLKAARDLDDGRRSVGAGKGRAGPTRRLACVGTTPSPAGLPQPGLPHPDCRSSSAPGRIRKSDRGSAATPRPDTKRPSTSSRSAASERLSAVMSAARAVLNRRDGSHDEASVGSTSAAAKLDDDSVRRSAMSKEERTRLRRASFAAADSDRSLFGHKEAPEKLRVKTRRATVSGTCTPNASSSCASPRRAPIDGSCGTPTPVKEAARGSSSSGAARPSFEPTPEGDDRRYVV